MRKFKINANKQQLESFGISYDLTGLIGILKHIYPSGWYELEVTHKIGDDKNFKEFTNNFDIPKPFLKEIK